MAAIQYQKLNPHQHQKSYNQHPIRNQVQYPIQTEDIQSNIPQQTRNAIQIQAQKINIRNQRKYQTKEYYSKLIRNH